jgi:hypothetical protein
MMNKIIYQIGAGFFILIMIILGLSYVNSPSIENSQPSILLGPSGSSEITLTAEFPTPPMQMMVYTVVPQNTREDAAKIAKKLGVTEELIERDNHIYTTGGSWDYSFVSKTGAFHYNLPDRTSGHDPIDVPEFLPGEGEAVTIAGNYLKSKDLWEEGAVFDEILYSEGYTIYGENNTKSLIHKTLLVRFNRVMNNYPVVGDYIAVEIGGNGDVIGLFKAWRTYTPDKEYAVISPEEAYQKLIENESMFPVSKDVQVSINRVYPGYATRTPSESMDLLKPVYAFDYETMSDGKPITGTVFIPAVPELGEL